MTDYFHKDFTPDALRGLSSIALAHMHGGLGGVVPELLGEVQPGLVGVGAEQKPGLSPE
mgnify:CR=1 FL=1